jgi:hypothetical protein
MSNPSMSATLVFALFAFGFIGVMLAGAFILDRRRVKDVHEAIPERSEGAFDGDRTDETPTGSINGEGDGGTVERPDGSVRDARRRGQ